MDIRFRKSVRGDTAGVRKAEMSSELNKMYLCELLMLKFISLYLFIFICILSFQR